MIISFFFFRKFFLCGVQEEERGRIPTPQSCNPSSDQPVFRPMEITDRGYDVSLTPNTGKCVNPEQHPWPTMDEKCKNIKPAPSQNINQMEQVVFDENGIPNIDYDYDDAAEYLSAHELDDYYDEDTTVQDDLQVSESETQRPNNRVDL